MHICSTGTSVTVAIRREDLEVAREQVKTTREGTCEYGYRAPVYSVTVEDTYLIDELERLHAYS